MSSKWGVSAIQQDGRFSPSKSSVVTPVANLNQNSQSTLRIVSFYSKADGRSHTSFRCSSGRKCRLMRCVSVLRVRVRSRPMDDTEAQRGLCSHDLRLRMHPRWQPIEYHDHTASGDGAVHLCNSDQLEGHRVLMRCQLCQWQGFLSLPTCSAFSILRRILEALSERGKVSSSPAKGPCV